MIMKWFFMKDEFIVANGIRMHYVTEGEGEPLLLLHGFPQFWYAWRHQIPVLSKHFKLIVPDLRGYGQTDRPPHIADYNIDLLGKDIVSLIQALGYKKAHIVGHDWGGAIAWHLALEHPDVIHKLIILNCPHPRIFSKALRSNFSQMRKSWYIAFFQLPYIPELLFKLFGRKMVKDAMRGSAIKKEAFTDEDINIYYNELMKPGAFSAALNYYRAAMRTIVCSKPSSTKMISTPTLVIWAENDIALGKELSYGMERLFSGPFMLSYVPHCSHWVNEEQPEKVNELIISFLEK